LPQRHRVDCNPGGRPLAIVCRIRLAFDVGPGQTGWRLIAPAVWGRIPGPEEAFRRVGAPIERSTVGKDRCGSVRSVLLFVTAVGIAFLVAGIALFCQHVQILQNWRSVNATTTRAEVVQFRNRRVPMYRGETE